jgi:hypothetical protein
MLSVLLTSITSKQKVEQSEWGAIEKHICMQGESGAPLHLKIKAYHVDLAQNDIECQGPKLEDIGSMVVPLQLSLKHINADSTRPFEEVRAKVRAQVIKYYHLVLDPK